MLEMFSKFDVALNTRNDSPGRFASAKTILHLGEAELALTCDSDIARLYFSSSSKSKNARSSGKKEVPMTLRRLLTSRDYCTWHKYCRMYENRSCVSVLVSGIFRTRISPRERIS